MGGRLLAVLFLSASISQFGSTARASEKTCAPTSLIGAKTWTGYWGGKLQSDISVRPRDDGNRPDRVTEFYSWGTNPSAGIYSPGKEDYPGRVLQNGVVEFGAGRIGFKAVPMTDERLYVERFVDQNLVAFVVMTKKQ